MSHSQSSSHARGTTHLKETPEQRVCNSDVNRNRVCENIHKLLSQPNVDLTDVEMKSGCTTDEIDRAKYGVVVPLDKQKRILAYFRITLPTAALEDLGRHLTLAN